MSKITSIEGQESINRTNEPLGFVWSFSSSKDSTPKKQCPFMFSGVDSKIPTNVGRGR